MPKYVIAEIEPAGYIRIDAEFSLDRTVHRETRNIDALTEYFDRLEDAKEQWSPEGDKSILALNREGGVESIWMAKSQVPELGKRLKTFSGCYGRWPILTFYEGAN